MKKADTKDLLHPRSRFRSRYDFPRLVAAHPALAAFVKMNAHGDAGIDYADPRAVKALNAALLADAYGLRSWDLPAGHLCPPIPGRSDYIHHLADLVDLRSGADVRVLDVGTGASVIYPLIGVCEYGWSFVGAEVDASSLHWAQKNAALTGQIELRQQRNAAQCFRGIILPGERFAATMCNPPFHASAAEASAGARRKQQNLGLKAQALNFGGTAGELWCEGGELGFVRRMIAESREFAAQCAWFTTLVSKSEHLPRFEKALRQVEAIEVRIIDMAQGQKKSRILAWRFGV
ncbi:23S rRNA (adenine(1618)-N(6))-methyltransferase RlmF [Prosthecobacter sp.]|uniref:23S rRNA (adenine(1618)-N(6))-methyltransferase RlmF n=1 Tax=Prosthecobacter sp. TaxID=1965333 RepID=UPI001D5FA05A|nr:23S rRNA (adenine(1618)-N(6))-methyltransferase RlmF [Prosthecobacter sp.]MCB1274941.1 23S rRNA (adenine(1618)-N(6))-methyltransferase RlmF [Prosthecobacter sp.]